MKNTPKIERRYYTFDIDVRKADNGQKYLTGRPIVYDSITDLGYYYEIIDRGALDGANLRDVPFLVNHNDKMIPCARSRRNNPNSTMQMSADAGGLFLNRIALDVENNYTSRALYSAVKRGDIDGMSFAFSIDGEKWENLESDHPTRHITSIGAVYEVSAVTFPAYASTEINARSKDALDSARSALEKARQQRAAAVDTVANELALAKARFNFNFKFGG